jgi:hypothetical protein
MVRASWIRYLDGKRRDGDMDTAQQFAQLMDAEEALPLMVGNREEIPRDKDSRACPDDLLVTATGARGRSTVSAAIVGFALRNGWQPRVRSAHAAEVDGQTVCTFLLEDSAAVELAAILSLHLGASLNRTGCGHICIERAPECIRSFVEACRDGSLALSFRKAPPSDESCEVRRRRKPAQR